MNDTEVSRRWRERNKEHLREYERERYHRRKEQKLAYLQEWRKAHPEAKRKENEKRKQRTAGLKLGVSERERLWIKQKGACGLCGGSLREMEFDHIVPLCRGGEHRIENIQLVHPTCNLQKGQKLVEECHWWNPTP